MKIRTATRHDTEAIIDMLRQYRDHSPILMHRQTQDDHARRVLDHIFAGMGQIWLSEEQWGVTGMLIAMLNPNLWDPKILVLNELAYWVNPEARGSSAGYRLIQAYKAYAEEQKALGNIHAYTISKMVTSPDLKYERFGFAKIEEMWGVQ